MFVECCSKQEKKIICILLQFSVHNLLHFVLFIRRVRTTEIVMYWKIRHNLKYMQMNEKKKHSIMKKNKN